MTADPMITDFLINLAAGLTQSLLEAGGARLKQAALDTAEERALKTALREGFIALLADVQSQLSPGDLHTEHTELARHIFADFVGHPPVAESLLSLALAGTPPDLAGLAAAFDALDFDRETLAVDFARSLTAYHRGVSAALVEEARQSRSPLFNQVSLGRILTIQTLLESQQQSLTAIADSVRRLENAGGQTVYNVVVERFIGAGAIDHQTLVVQPSLPPEIQQLLAQILARLDGLSPARPPTFNPSDIYNGCHNVTSQYARDLLARLAPHPTVMRQSVNERLEGFLASSMRYTVILGPSSVGKSVTLAKQAQVFMQDGWATLLIPAKLFSLDYLAERIANDGLGYEQTPAWRQVLVTPWLTTMPEHLKGSLLVLDAVDESDYEVIEQELSRLHNASGNIDPRHFKIVISCRDFVWNRNLTRASFFTGSSSLQVIEVTDFTDRELEGALSSIGATELLEARPPGEPPDPHLETLRDLLKHPGTFGLYAQTRASGGAASVSQLTWSLLIERYLEALQQVGRRCDKTPDFMREQLISFVKLVREQEARDFRLPKDLLRNELPELAIDTNNPRLSPYSALLDHNFLFESTGPGASHLVAFTNTDVGSFLLSFVLEREVEQQSSDSLEELITGWFTESHRFTPVLDAVLAWLDRLITTNPRSDVLLTLLRRIVEGHMIRAEVFRLVHPTILDALFNVVAKKRTEHLYAYREAVREVRFSPDALAIARRRIFSHNVQIQELAVIYISVHCDAESSPQLIDLLEGSGAPDGEDRGVKEAAYAAFRQIGPPALHSLMQVIRDTSAHTGRRSHCLGALRAIGFRNEEVSAILSSCLNEAKTTADMELLKSALLAAAHVRDKTQTQHARDALSSTDWQVVQYAAKFLTEVPDTTAVTTLQETVRRACTANEESRMWRDFALRQCMAALVQLDTEESKSTVVQILQEGLQRQSTLSPVWAIWAAGDLAVPAANALLLEFWIQILCETPQSGLVWHAIERLKRIWQPNHLNSLTRSAAQLAADGNNIARIVVEAILESNASETNHPLKDHHTRVSGVHILAKCQAAGFSAEVGQLLQEAEWSFDLNLYDALWLVGSTDAEEALLHELSSTSFQSKVDSRLMRALGTCGRQEGANVVLEHLRSSTEIALPFFPEEGICPLIRRGMLDTEDLVAVVSSDEASPEGRTASLIALGIVAALAHKDLFIETVTKAENHTLQGYAARLLRFTDDTSTAPILRRVLRSTSDPFVAEQAAETLAWLGDHEAVPLVESKLIDFIGTHHAEGLAGALEKYGQPSSLPILLELLETTHSMGVEYRIIEALGAFLSDERAKQTVVNWLETWHGTGFDAGRQSPAIRALARYDPAYLLNRAVALYDAGRLYNKAREQLARWIPYLARQEECRGRMLIEITKRLICDREISVRELIGQSLSHMENALPQTVYAELSTSSDEWSNACAVYSLGFVQGDADAIQTHRYAPSFTIRYFADRALETLQRRGALTQLVEMYQAGSGIDRLSAYLSIVEQGDEETIATLNKAVNKEDLNHIFLRQLSRDVAERVRKERRERAKKEQKTLDSAGTVSFD